MGKSPAKWIKSVLLGKKSSRGRNGLKSANKKGDIAEKEPPFVTLDSPEISEPILVNNKKDGMISESANKTASNLAVDAVALVTNQSMECHENAGESVARNAKNANEELAAVKVQAAFRGYLSRRAFRVLKGIIRLQAVVRGHLVRRQAIATLYCMHGIVKLQATIRGRRARASNIGHEVKFRYLQMKDVLLSRTSVTEPLKIHYIQGEANSTLTWLERWTLSHFWVPLPKPKKAVTSKSHLSKIAVEGEYGVGKGIVFSNSLSAAESGPNIATSEPERLRHSLKKLSEPPADCVPENPPSELEKVKRSLRKVSHSTGNSCEKPLAENQKAVRISRKVTTLPPDASEQEIDEPLEKIKKDIPVNADTKFDAVNVTVPAVSDESNNALEASMTIQVNASESLQREDGSMNEEPLPKEPACDEIHTSIRKRASISSKSEQFGDVGLESTPKVPSYMAATESAKAKSRGQVSPRLGSDSAERASITRRHSLPSSVNGKLSSQSPRTQKLIQATCKVGVRNERSLLSSRDGSEKAIQVAWRR